MAAGLGEPMKNETVSIHIPGLLTVLSDGTINTFLGRQGLLFVKIHLRHPETRDLGGPYRGEEIPH